MAAPSLSSRMRHLIDGGWIGPVNCAGREILRRIFVTVRDRNWREVRPTEFHRVIDEVARTARLRARHTSDLVDFEWRGEVTLSQSGEHLRFSFEGRALRDMEICRLGLVVLHPVESMMGSTVTISHEHVQQTFTVDRRIAPQPIINGIPGAMTDPFSTLRVERDDFGSLQLTFSGELFELEDQRNWGDASFKSYCTPLRLGFPRAIGKDTVLRHGVDVRYAAVATSPRIMALEPAPRPQDKALRPPAFGKVWRGEAVSDAASWDYLHVDLGGRDHTALRSVTQIAGSQQLEIGLDADNELGNLAGWIDLIREHRERIVRLLFYGPAISLPSGTALERWRNALEESLGQPLPMYAATRGYFVEFNRSQSFAPPVDGIAFPLTATVHCDDPQTLMSNVATIRDIAQTAQQLTQTSGIALAPLALYHPPAAAAPRLPQPFVVQWLAATLRHAAAAEVASITFGDDLATALRLFLGACPPKTLAGLLETRSA